MNLNRIARNLSSGKNLAQVAAEEGYHAAKDAAKTHAKVGKNAERAQRDLQSGLNDVSEAYIKLIKTGHQRIQNAAQAFVDLAAQTGDRTVEAILQLINGGSRAISCSPPGYVPRETAAGDHLKNYLDTYAPSPWKNKPMKDLGPCPSLRDRVKGELVDWIRPPRTSGPDDRQYGVMPVPYRPVTGGNGSYGPSILDNPNLSLEEKLALLMAKLSEHFDKEIEEKMAEMERLMTRENKEANQREFNLKTDGFDWSFVPGAGQEQSSSDLQLAQTQLQMALQKRQQMFQTMSSILKSVHDTSMAAIRNLKA